MTETDEKERCIDACAAEDFKLTFLEAVDICRSDPSYAMVPFHRWLKYKPGAEPCVLPPACFIYVDGGQKLRSFTGACIGLTPEELEDDWAVVHYTLHRYPLDFIGAFKAMQSGCTVVRSGSETEAEIYRHFQFKLSGKKLMARSSSISEWADDCHIGGRELFDKYRILEEEEEEK